MPKPKSVRPAKVANDVGLDEAPASAVSESGEYHVEDQIGFIVRRVHQRCSLIFQQIMKDSEVSPTQFAALIKARDSGRVSQNELGRLTFMDPATTMGVVLRLVDRDLLRRFPDPVDRRKVLLSITAKGLALVENYEARAHEVSRATLAPLHETERQAILSLLTRIL